MLVPKVIALEGCDGVGKTAYTTQLKDFFEKNGKRVARSSTPSKDLPLGELARLTLSPEKGKEAWKKAQTLGFSQREDLFLAAIVEVAEYLCTLRNAFQYDVYLLDRWWPSHLAYDHKLTRLTPTEMFSLIKKMLSLQEKSSILKENKNFSKRLFLPHFLYVDFPSQSENAALYNKILENRMKDKTKGTTSVYDDDLPFQFRVRNNYRKLMNFLNVNKDKIRALDDYPFYRADTIYPYTKKLPVNLF